MDPDIKRGGLGAPHLCACPKFCILVLGIFSPHTAFFSTNKIASSVTIKLLYFNPGE